MIAVDTYGVVNSMEPMGNRLRLARIEAGFKSGAAAARRLGVKTSTYNAHENTQNDFGPEEADHYGRTFGVRAAWLLTAELPKERSGGKEEPIAAANKLPSPNASLPEPVRYGRERRPMYGQIFGGRSDQGRIILSDRPIAHLVAPPIVEHVPEAFALQVAGESMLERFRPGDVAWVNPTLRVAAGDDVFIELLDDDGETRVGYVKRFVSRSDRELVVKQLNPPEGEGEILRFAGDRVIRVLLIVDISIGR